MPRVCRLPEPGVNVFGWTDFHDCEANWSGPAYFAMPSFSNRDCRSVLEIVFDERHSSRGLSKSLVRRLVPKSAPSVLCRELVHGRLSIDLARLKNRTGELRLIWRVGEVLAF